MAEPSPTAGLQAFIACNDKRSRGEQITEFEVIPSASNADGEYRRDIKYMAEATVGTSEPFNLLQMQRKHLTH